MYIEWPLCTVLGGTYRNAADPACSGHDERSVLLSKKLQRQRLLASTVLTIRLHYITLPLGCSMA